MKKDFQLLKENSERRTLQDSEIEEFKKGKTQLQRYWFQFITNQVASQHWGTAAILP